jgi:ADP-ribose pyrophosphatase YjhB (NUDIX family)
MNKERKPIVLLPLSRDTKCFFFGILLSFVLMGVFQVYQNGNSIESLIPSTLRQEGPQVPMAEFPEPPWRTPQTLAVTTVASTPFARFEVHQVKTESGEIVNDWLWTDERAHVNILVHLKKENKYLLFHQKKYGLDRAYYAAVGGLFNIGDTPNECAKRELLEETGLESEELVYLGKYRVQVNRGGGILHAYLAKNCVLSSKKKHSDDYEKQEKRLLTREELIDLTLKGEVGEAQWVATVALGLLHEEKADRVKKTTP